MAKNEKQSSQNVHVIRMAKSLAYLPIATVIFLVRNAKKLLGSSRSPRDRRQAEKLRQSRARRQLRGLPPDHQTRK